MALERLSHILSLKHTRFIDFAGETPGRSEIDKNGSALLQFTLQAFGRERLPATLEVRICGSNFCGPKFVANKINTAPDHEQEHESENDAPFYSWRCWHNEGAFHPARDADHKQETACPDRSLQAPLCADYVKQEEQCRQQKEAHELFHVHHPRSRLWQESKPRRLRAQKQIGRAHTGSDGNEHRHDDRGRLREREAERGAKKWRRARRSQYRREHPLEKGAEQILAVTRRKQIARNRLWQRNLKHSEEIQREYEHNYAQDQNEVRISKLKTAPGYITPGAFKDDQ